MQHIGPPEKLHRDPILTGHLATPVLRLDAARVRDVAKLRLPAADRRLRAGRHGVTWEYLAASLRLAEIFADEKLVGVQMSERSSNLWLSELKGKVPVGS